MSEKHFKDLFNLATGGNKTPFAYQVRLACGTDTDDTRGTECGSRLIDIPTGCGKTAAVVLAWMWNRVECKKSDWPRRLVYCLPMRTLVEQTRDEVERWLGNKLWDGKTDHAGKVGVHILMGGEEAGKWDEHPEADAILIGTQDMLISRALNRGYGMSRYRWPMHFGLLNNDCLWIMDETQLMGVSVETSAQLDAFRQKLGVQAGCHCWWMSATLESGRLETVDHPAPADGWPRTKLGVKDFDGPVRDRWESRKTLAPAGGIRLVGTGGKETTRYARELASFVHKTHVENSLTLVIVNRVVRAQEIYNTLIKNPPVGAKIALIHSRFRPPDRKGHENILFKRDAKDAPDLTENRVVIATQAIEAGVDVSARTLITELAPWSSLVQRFGRCNRYGECIGDVEAKIFWADIVPKDDKDAAPYTSAELKSARDLLLDGRTHVGPKDLAGVRAPEAQVIRPVLRRKDLLDLFDTTADLLGNDLDVSRYVRDGEDTDVQVFWRVLGDKDVDVASTIEPVREELCRVSVSVFADFIRGTKPRTFVWNTLDGKWERLNRARAGIVCLLDASSGGYDSKLGWTGQAGGVPIPTSHAPVDGESPEAYDDDRTTFLGENKWVTLLEHVANVTKTTDGLTKVLNLEKYFAAMHNAAAWHDVGKSHETFQEMVTRGDAVSSERHKQLWAKSDRFRGFALRDGQTCPFRHELASALAWLQNTSVETPDRDLVAYIIAAHHGKVRLSIRSMPDENGPKNAPNLLFARGVWENDPLPGSPFTEVQVDGKMLPRFNLDLRYMLMGDDEHRGPSWLARTLALREDPALGPFRLAYLETILRVADWRVSAAEKRREA